MINITEVRVSRDLSIAKIYVTVIDADSSDNSKAESVKLLNKMSGYLRTELASKIKIRNIPELRFYQDTIAESSNRIEELLDRIKKES